MKDSIVIRLIRIPKHSADFCPFCEGGPNINISNVNVSSFSISLAERVLELTYDRSSALAQNSAGFIKHLYAYIQI